MHTAHDESVVLAHAHALYRRSGLVEAFYILAGVAVCAVIGALIVITRLETYLIPGFAGASVIASALIGGMLGWGLGRDRALAMRCQANLALVQVQIERNTRQAVHLLAIQPRIPSEVRRVA